MASCCFLSRVWQGCGDAWTRFWHTPLRAERLAVTRILLGVALFTQILLLYVPYLNDLYGPQGTAPAGLHDQWQLTYWRWTMLFFYTDNLSVIYASFGVWAALALLFALGWHTRVVTVLLWFVTMCIHNRNPSLLNFGDDVLRVGLFFLMLAPSGRALSLDRLRELRRLRARDPRAARLPPLTPAWPVRLLQIQLCVMYLTTGLAKLIREPDWFTGTWWDGTSIHYVLNNMTLAHWSYAQLPVPYWITMPATYLSVWWEALFIPLVLCRWTRKWTLWFGVLFHLGIFIALEVGWFSFFSIALYGVWIPGTFWDRWLGGMPRPPANEPDAAENGRPATAVREPQPAGQV